MGRPVTMELVHHRLEVNAARHPRSTALVHGEQRVSYAGLDRAANRLAHGLIARGVAPGDRVAVLLDNSVEAVVSIFGVLKAGAAFTLLSPTTKSEKLAFVVADERPAALITINDPQRRKVISGLPSGALPPCVVWVGGSPDLDAEGWTGWDSLDDGVEGCPPDARIDDEHIGTIIYTSGTTGEPKGVVSLHRDMVFATASINTYLEHTDADVLFCALPLAFTYGLYQLLTAVAAGAALVLERNFAFPARALRLMERERVTGFAGVPTMFSLLLRSGEIRRCDTGSLRYMTNAAAPLPEERLEQVRRAFPQVRFYSMYGMTECKRASYLPPEELDRRPGSVGRPIPGTDAYIVDGSGRPVGPGSEGELVLVGPHLMAGYWERPDQTAERLRPGRVPGEVALHTGDLFRSDADGYLYFVSRSDDIIKTAGLKVSPLEIERSLRALPGVVDVAAVGVPDDLLGEAVKVFIVPEADSGLTERTVLGFCRQRLEEALIPKHVSFCAALPTSDNGKVLRRNLRSCAG